MSNMGYNDRIRALISGLGISVSAFAKKLGMTQSSVDRYVKGESKLSWEFAEKILLVYPNISAEWLMRGEGSMIKHTAGNVDQQPSVGEEYYSQLVADLADMKQRVLDLENKVS